MERIATTRLAILAVGAFVGVASMVYGAPILIGLLAVLGSCSLVGALFTRRRGSHRGEAWASFGLVAALVLALILMVRSGDAQTARAYRADQRLADVALSRALSAERALAVRYGRYSLCSSDLDHAAPGLLSSITVGSEATGADLGGDGQGGSGKLDAGFSPAARIVSISIDYSAGALNSKDTIRTASIDAGGTPVVTSCS